MRKSAGGSRLDGDKIPANSGHLAGPVVKRRASRACHSCRVRKIKCNVVKSGIPCSNCGLDDLNCVVSTSRRRKRFLVDEAVPKQYHGSAFSGSEDENGEPVISSLDGFLATFPTSLDFTLSDRVVQISDKAVGHMSRHTDRKSPRSSIASPLSALHLALPKQALDTPFQTPSGSQGLALPNYVHSLPLHLSTDDVKFLNTKGALSVPNTELRNELLRNYVQYVHPMLPFLDLQDFLESVRRDDGSSQISLMLFYAVMFAASAYVDISLLRAEGYETRKAARKSYFEKAKLLYHFDYASDRIMIVQALVLLTYWYETPDDQKDPSDWIGTCLSFVYAIGLHRNAEQLNFDAKEQRMRKRLWWSCFMRERLIAISMRKPTHIRRDDYDIPMLVLDDLETQPLSQQVIDMIGDCSAEINASTKSVLTKLCIEKAKLCVCIADVLATQYYVLGNRIGATAETTMMITPKKSAPESFEFIKCEQGLNLWYGNLPKDCQFIGPETTDNAYNDGREVLQVHRAILSMVYSTTLSALHRPRIVSKLPSQVVAKNFQQLSRQRVREAATSITDIAQDLRDHDLIRFLPPVAVTVLIPATLVHILDMRSNLVSVRDSGLRCYYLCMDVLQQLREMYYSADAAFLFLEAALGRLNVELPVLMEVQQAVPVPMQINLDDAVMVDATVQIADFPRPSPDFHTTINHNLITTPRALFREDQIANAGVASSSLPSKEPMNLPVNPQSNEDLDALNYFNMWPHIFEGETCLSFDPDVDWAVDFSAYSGVDSSLNSDQVAHSGISAIGGLNKTEIS